MNISISDIKKALADQRFTDTLPETLKKSVEEYTQNPCSTCPQNKALFSKLVSEHKEQLQKYYPDKQINENFNKQQNSFEVIADCHVGEIEMHLRNCQFGRKTITIARYQDRATIIINHLD